MNTIGGDSEDKIVVDTLDLDSVATACTTSTARRDDPVNVRAKGTRDQLPLPRRRARERMAVLTAEPPPAVEPAVDPPPAMAASSPLPAPRPAPPRDPVDVLRTWPHSIATVNDPAAPPRAKLRAPTAGRPLEDKVALAHLALDLYRELEEIQLAAHAAPPPPPRSAPRSCDAQCQARTNALRGALIEACLLVQRLVLLTPAAPLDRDEVNARIRDLLSLVDH